MTKTKQLPPADDCEVLTWFERDRANVEIRYGRTTVVEWWDEAVAEAAEDGFLDPRDWRGSAIAYAKTLGLIA